MRFFAFAICTFILTTPSAASGQSEEARVPGDHKVFEYLINGWKSEREKLLFGKVDCVGVYRTTEGGKHELFVSLLFDNLRDRKRMYMDWPGASGWWMRTPEQNVTSPKDGTPIVTVRKPSTTVPFQLELDPRCFGACDVAEFDRGLNFGDLTLFWSGAHTRSSYKVTPQENRTWHVEGIRRFDGGGVLRTTIVINEAKGFSFEKLEFARKVNLDNPREGWVATTTECEWAQKGEIWVPVKLVCHGIFNERSIELKLAWGQVGESPGDDEFTLAKLRIPDKRMILDQRLSEDKPVLVGFTDSSPEPPPLLTSTRGPLSPKTIVLVAATVGVVIVLSAVYYMRRRRKSKAAG